MCGHMYEGSEVFFVCVVLQHYNTAPLVSMHITTVTNKTKENN